ncbi:MAG TPA: glycosyltransferase [Thermoleophilaceae bacterium]|nr:glycosyltransferase [Thermoleophilaceae bacterium]
MSISVVIPTLNRPDALPRTLDALAGQTFEDFEVVVVEDAKNEAPITNANLDIRTLRAAAPGASHARNTGWRAAVNPVVLFLGDDIIPSRELLARHAALHAEHPQDDVGVLGHVEWARELKRTAFMVWLDHGIQFNYPSILGTEAGPGHLYTANVSLKRTALERVGGFDAERYPFLYEDIDLGVRLFEQGFRLIYEREASAEHLHDVTLERWKARMAIQARAERAWVRHHPDEEPYFYTRFSEALRHPPARGRIGRALLPHVPRTTPVIGDRVWRRADLYFRQQLGRPFVDAWDQEERAASSGGSSPGGPK